MSHNPSERSATMAPTLWLVSVASLFLFLTAYASDPPAWEDPTWWTSYGAMNTNTANNSAVANQGELKQFTSAAAQELDQDLAASGGAGLSLENLVIGWQQDYNTNGYSTNTASPSYPYKPSDYQAVNVGQLKYIAKLLYGQLYDAGYGALYPSWIQQNTSTDSQAATIGQMKSVFNYDFSLYGPESLTATSNTNGVVNLTWQLIDTTSPTSYLLEQQNVDGSWKTIATITNLNTSSYTVTNLATGENPTFQIIAQNGIQQSTAQDTPSDSGIVAPSLVHGTQGQNPGEIDLTWQNNATDATYITVDESPDGVNWSIIATLSPTATSFAVTNLVVGQAYYFGVSAGNN